MFTLLAELTFSQTILSADGPGIPYELINAVLAFPNKNVIETSDCNHTAFGNHIDEIFDTVLNKTVFRLYIHVSPDNDCFKKFDRQRNEIKTYVDSPENLKATIGEIVVYKWKFKISNHFNVSSSFTHLHQIKSVVDLYVSTSMISLTLRKASLDKLELRYTVTKDQKTLKTANLNLFRGKWVAVTETIHFGNLGRYSIEIKDIATNKDVFRYRNNLLDTRQHGTEFARPKWGIYRGLNFKEDLKDEMIKYADFSIQEITSIN